VGGESIAGGGGANVAEGWEPACPLPGEHRPKVDVCRWLDRADSGQPASKRVVGRRRHLTPIIRRRWKTWPERRLRRRRSCRPGWGRGWRSGTDAAGLCHENAVGSYSVNTAPGGCDIGALGQSSGESVHGRASRVPRQTTVREGGVVTDDDSKLRRSKTYPRVFISCARDDLPVASRCKAMFEEQGVDCWLDKSSIKPGSDWQSEIENELSRAKLILIILSKFSNPRSPDISNEWALLQLKTWQRDDLSVCSLHVDDAKTPPFLRKWQSLKLPQSQKGWDELSARVKEMLAGTADLAEDKEGRVKEISERFDTIEELITEASRNTQAESDDE
jgi:hypothetical protein